MYMKKQLISKKLKASLMMILLSSYLLSKKTANTQLINRVENISEIEMIIGTEAISKEAMMLRLAENIFICDYDKERIQYYIEEIYLQFPNIDKRLLYKSLKNLEIVYGAPIYEDNKVVTGRSFMFFNMIYLTSESNEDLYHELTHFLLEAEYLRNFKFYSKYFYMNDKDGSMIGEGLVSYIVEAILNQDMKPESYYHIHLRYIKRLMSVVEKESFINNFIGSNIYDYQEVNAYFPEPFYLDMDQFQEPSSIKSLGYQKYMLEEMKLFMTRNLLEENYSEKREAYFENLEEDYQLLFLKMETVYNPVRLALQKK